MVQTADGQAVEDNYSDENAKVWTRKAALWVGVWFAIALAIRLMNLASKPPWGDEISTILFSMGNSSRLIPLNEVISIDQILRPLQVTPGATPWDAARFLLAENNHPPAYFALAQPWMQWFARSDGYASVWAARALSSLFGALGVPVIYGLAWASFRDRTLAILCAALMAVSPFAVFLAQEARHYTLAILVVMASLSCFVLAFRALYDGKSPSWPVTFGWIVANAVGISVHYFTGITIVAEALTLLVLLVYQSRQKDKGRENGAIWRKQGWIRIYIAAVGTFLGAVVWLPILLNFYGSPQSSFLRSGPSSWKYWVDPIAQSVAGWLYAVISPITNYYGAGAIAIVVLTCVLLLLVYAPWLIANLRRALRFQMKRPQIRPGLLAIGGFFIIANLLFLLICYGLGFDITRGHRYSFVFFPSILILVGAGLAPFWTERDRPNSQRFNQVTLPFIKRSISGKTFVVTVLFVGFLGALTITNNLSHLKFYKADRFIDLVQAESQFPVVIGAETTIADQPVVVGIEIVSTALEAKRQLEQPDDAQGWQTPPRFVIAENNAAKGLDANEQLVESLKAVARPFDLWLLSISPDLDSENCPAVDSGNKGSYSYKHYRCEARS